MSDEQCFVDNAADLLKEYGPRLRELRGKPLEASWVAWDECEDSWLNGEAVILRIGADNLEIVCQKFDEVALTWNTIDVSGISLTYPWDGESKQSWRRDALPALTRGVGGTVEGLSVVEHRAQVTVLKDGLHPENVGQVFEPWLLFGLEFYLGQNRLVIYNAVNANGITADLPTGTEFRRVPVW